MNLDLRTDADLLAMARNPTGRTILERLLDEAEHSIATMASIHDDAAQFVRENETLVTRLRMALEATAREREL
ncbi:hypothetical protein [Luteibacter sp.]|uniref:hypothetical protein n=1 Tax=Luteibacter sp. TaxID=1886636 RepID=UPI00280A1F9D|nr:hypothetical protein [Luteibacter sp.]MDQ8050854.1 hypothetical protein [Luteibacter sp.]